MQGACDTLQCATFDWVANAMEPTFVDPNSWIEARDFVRDGLRLNGGGKRTTWATIC